MSFLSPSFFTGNYRYYYYVVFTFPDEELRMQRFLHVINHLSKYLQSVNLSMNPLTVAPLFQGAIMTFSLRKSLIFIFWLLKSRVISGKEGKSSSPLRGRVRKDFPPLGMSSRSVSGGSTTLLVSPSTTDSCGVQTSHFEGWSL